MPRLPTVYALRRELFVMKSHQSASKQLPWEMNGERVREKEKPLLLLATKVGAEFGNVKFDEKREEAKGENRTQRSDFRCYQAST